MKIAALIIGALFLGAVAGLAAPLSKPSFSVSPAALYQTDNELYFDNKLPKDVTVVAEEAPDTAPNHFFYGETSHAVSTHWYKMYVSPKHNTSVDLEEETVLHESCHIKVWEKYENRGVVYGGGEHGPEWQACMLNLAEQGAFKDIW